MYAGRGSDAERRFTEPSKAAWRPGSRAVQGPDYLVHQPGRLAQGWAAGRTAWRADANLQMGGVGDADDAAADLGDRLTRLHVRPDRNQRRRGVAVVDVTARQRSGGDLQHRGIGPEPADA